MTIAKGIGATFTQLGQMSKCPVWKMRLLKEQGQLEAEKVGNAWLVPPHEVARITREYPLEVQNDGN